MKQLALKLTVALLRLIYIPFRSLPVRRKVTIISRQSDKPSDDIRMLAEYLRREHPEVECRVLCRFIHPNPGSRIRYLFHMLTQMKNIAQSRAVVLDGYCITACVLNHRPETKILQIWHAVAAIKKFGFQSIDQPGGHSRMVAETMCMHRNYDYVLCPSPATGMHFAQAFRVDPSRLVYMALPRLDLLKEPDAETAAQTSTELRSACGIPEDRELLLYVPTFRKGRAVRLDDLIRSVDYRRFALVIRLHPLEKPVYPADPGGEEDGRFITFTRRGSTEEWIRAADRIITDYSALAVEAALTGKPLYYYIYDVEEYEQSVGLNVDPRKEMPHASAVTGEQLAQLLAGEYPFGELKRFREKYITVDTDACTERLGEFVYGMAEDDH